MKETAHEHPSLPSVEECDNEASIREKTSVDELPINLNDLSQIQSDEMSTEDFMPTIAKSDEEEPESNEPVGDKLMEPDLERRPRRLAAVRALGKIQEWTRNLSILLQSSVGCVAMSAK